MRILVAEDELAIREVLAELLDAAGHDVTFAETFPDAEHLLGSGSWDLMLADLELPGGDGLGLAVAARARGMRAIVCTGHPEPVDTLADQGIGYLQKPFTLGALLALIEQPAAEPGLATPHTGV